MIRGGEESSFGEKFTQATVCWWLGDKVSSAGNGGALGTHASAIIVETDCDFPRVGGFSSWREKHVARNSNPTPASHLHDPALFPQPGEDLEIFLSVVAGGDEDSIADDFSAQDFEHVGKTGEGGEQGGVFFGVTSQICDGSGGRDHVHVSPMQGSGE